MHCLPLCSSFLNRTLLAGTCPAFAEWSHFQLCIQLCFTKLFEKQSWFFCNNAKQTEDATFFVQSDMWRTASAHGYRALCRASAEAVASSAARSHTRALCVAQPVWSPALALLKNAPAALSPRVQHIFSPTLMSGSCRWRTGVSTCLLASLQSDSVCTRDLAAVHGHKIKTSDVSPSFMVNSSTPVHGRPSSLACFCRLHSRHALCAQQNRLTQS